MTAASMTAAPDSIRCRAFPRHGRLWTRVRTAVSRKSQEIRKPPLPRAATMAGMKYVLTYRQGRLLRRRCRTSRVRVQDVDGDRGLVAGSAEASFGGVGCVDRDRSFDHAWAGAAAPVG